MQKHKRPILEWFLHGTAISVVAFLVVAPFSSGAAISGHDTPKIANIFLHWSMSEQEARDLSRWDIVIFDMEIGSHNPDLLQLMRRLNPNIKLLAYITPAEIRQDATEIASASPLRARLARRIAPEWYLTNDRGERRTFWAGTWILNLTERSPVVGGKQWSDELVAFIRDEIIATGLWDGVLFDNAWENITYFAGTNVDLNRDGSVESIRDADETWRRGMRALYAKARATLPPGTLIMENDGQLYTPDVQGVIFENFPAGGWQTRLRQVDRVSREGKDPRVAIINSNTGNSGRRDDYRRFRYSLASGLLYDAYTSFDFGDQDHGQAWWYDEYDESLGSPRSAARRVDRGTGVGVWQRDFERGLVVVNADRTPQIVRFPIEVERIRGSQDPGTNSGRITSEVTISGEDGLVLLRPVQTIVGAAYPNGSFARILDVRGSPVRAGAFAAEAAAGTGATVLRTDLGHDGRAELVVSENGVVRVMDERGTLLFRFTPYGSRFRGPVSVAVGDTDGNGEREIITVPGARGGAHVKMWTTRGQFLHEFFAFDAAFQGGASIAASDTDGDGRDEIIVGAGAGGAPIVRVFDGQGRPTVGFVAYVPRFRGGVSVAAADFDGDRRAEIVTGAGPGGGPHVRLWSSTGSSLGGFFALDPSNTGGIVVGAADATADGLPEIVVFATQTVSIR